MQTEEKQSLNLNDISLAYAQALKQGVSVIELLEETSGYTPNELIQ